MKRLILFMLMIMFFQSTCHAADWVWVGSNDDVSVYLDSQSIYLEQEKTNTSIAILDCWTKFEYQEPQEDGTNSKLIEYRFKLIDKIHNAWFSVSSYLAYDLDGNLIKSDHYQGDEWQKVPPDSVIQYVCWRAIKCIEEKNR